MANDPNRQPRALIVRPPAIAFTPDEEKKLTDPQQFDNLVAHIACGGTLVDLAEAWGVRFAALAHWLDLDVERRERFTMATIVRDEYQREKLRQQLIRIFSVDLRQIFNSDGSVRPISEIPKEALDCVASIDQEELWDGRGEGRERVGTTKKIKLHPKLEAIKLAGIELGMFKERKVHEVGDTLEDLVAKSWSRPDGSKEREEIIDATILPKGDPMPAGEGGNDSRAQIKGGLPDSAVNLGEKGHEKNSEKNPG